jgi:hypothetical protein
MTIDLQAYDNRLRLMLVDAIPGTKVVTDWPAGNSGVDWWSILSFDQNIVTQFGHETILWRIEAQIAYVFANESEGNKGPTRAKLNTLLPQISQYFASHIQMTTDDQDSTDIIAGFTPGSFRAKYLKEQVYKNKRILPFTVTFNHKESIKKKEN